MPRSCARPDGAAEIRTRDFDVSNARMRSNDGTLTVDGLECAH